LVGLGCSNIVPVLFSSVGRQTVMPENVAVPAIMTLGYAGMLRRLSNSLNFNSVELQVKSVERDAYRLLNDCAKSKTFDQILANEERKQNHRQIDDDGGGTEFAPQHHSIRHQGRRGDRQSACMKICEKNCE
jgi:hypothetical protein